MHPDTPAGEYVRLKVCDTGTGMSKEVIERAFEPFYSHEVLVPERLAELPGSAFIEKPFNAEALLRTVEEVLVGTTQRR